MTLTDLLPDTDQPDAVFEAFTEWSAKLEISACTRIRKRR